MIWSILSWYFIIFNLYLFDFLSLIFFVTLYKMENLSFKEIKQNWWYFVNIDQLTLK